MQCISYGDTVVTHIPPQQSFLDKRVNFRFTYLNREAAKLFTPPMSVQPHAQGSG